jgi:hypothetical protein
MEVLHGALEAPWSCGGSHWSFRDSPLSVEVIHGAIEAHPGAAEAHIGAVQSWLFLRLILPFL